MRGRRANPWLAVALLAAGCMFHGSVHVLRPDPAPAFTADDEAAARSAVARIARAADFSETATPESLSADPASPYRWIAAFSGEGSEQDTVRIAVGLRKDGREIRVAVSDSARGTPRELMQAPADEYVRRLMETPTRQARAMEKLLEDRPA